MRSELMLALLLAAPPVAIGADDLDAAYQNLQDAVSKKDPAQVKKLASQTCTLARQAASESAPADADQEAWKKHLEYVHSVESYTEYALYATAVQQDAATLVDLMSTLEAQNPKSKYLDEGYVQYLYALSKTGGGEAKVVAVAGKAIVNFPANPDLLLVLANSALAKNQADRALEYATRLVAAAGKRPRPEGVAAADWERSRNASLGRGYWIAGVISAQKNKYGDADRNLRAALPLVQSDDTMKGLALFHLGVCDYQIGKATLDKAKVLEAAKFSEEAAKFSTPYAHQAYLNSQIMKTEAAKMR
jgi:hypothetical protein